MTDDKTENRTDNMTMTMIKFKAFLRTKKALPVIAVAGIAFMMFIIKLQPGLSHNPAQRPSAPVSYIELQEHKLNPEIIGYGIVEPDKDLQSKAEVTGRITYIHPSLKKGEIFAKETLLIQIDDKDYLLQLKQSEADVVATQANLNEMIINIENIKLELTLATQKLKVREKEYARLSKLRKSGSVSQSSLEKERQNLLQQKQEMQQLKNKQTTLPSQLEVVKARLAISDSKLLKSQRDLERTQIRIPFDGRISQVYTELDQFVATGTPLFDAFGLEKVIVNAQFPIDQFRLFAKNFKITDLQSAGVSSAPSMTQVLESFGLSAKIEVAGGDFTGWTAEVERFSDDLDPRSRTIGVIVSVKDSYQNILPGSRPPLLEGMYMKVMLQGAPITAVVLPRFSLHEDQVYLITAEDKLKRIKLHELQYQGGLVLINDQLQAGSRIITSDVFPAVDGMSVSPIIDKVTNAQMDEWLGVVK